MASRSFQALVWDLSGTLFKIDRTLISPRERHKFALLFYIWGGTKKLSPVEKKAFDLLYTLGEQEPRPVEEQVKTSQGTLLPEIIYAWFAGLISSEQAHDYTMQAYTRARTEGYFHNTTEALGAKHLLANTFNYQAIARCTRSIEPMLALLKHYAHTESLPLYVLSNWDPASFQVLSKLTTGMQVLRFFGPQAVMISGTVGMLKPRHEIFEHFLKQYKLNPQETIFVDNQQENIAMGEHYGMQGVWFKNGNAESVREQLKNLLGH